jgi:hypothetical protein
LEPRVPELIHRADRSQDLALAGIVEERQQAGWSLAPALQLGAGQHRCPGGGGHRRGTDPDHQTGRQPVHQPIGESARQPLGEPVHQPDHQTVHQPDHQTGPTIPLPQGLGIERAGGLS